MMTARGLRKSYGSTTVLEDVSLAVAPGQCLALLGPNGAGKTTLLRILATLLRPSAGTLTVSGVDALRRPEAARAAVGLLGHGSWVYDDLTALENLRFWVTMAGGDASEPRLRRALQQVELESVARERARTFSSGMKRRLALARILLGEARLLLLDEPFTGLDQRGRKWLAEFVLAFKGRGGAVVVATHSFGSSLGVADRIGILAGGRLAAEREAAALTLDQLRRLYESLTEADGTTA